MMILRQRLDRRLVAIAMSAVAVVSAAAVLKGTYDLGWVLLQELRGALDYDALIYFTVARGILDGLLPYVDLFESKPPGMYFFTALSLVLAGNESVALWLQALFFLLLPLALALFAWRESREAEGGFQWPIIAVAGLMGIQLTLYLEERGCCVQAEAVGSFFASMYLLEVLWHRERVTRSATALRRLLLLLSIGMKEPFLIPISAGALLLSSGWRRFLGTFVLPLLIAGAAGFVLLVLLRYLPGYLHVYLPAMTQARVTNNPIEPFLVRGFAVSKVLYNLTTAYTAPLLGGVLALWWLLVPVFRSGKDRLSEICLTLGTSALAYYVLSATWVLAVFTLGIMNLDVAMDWGFVAGKFGWYLSLLAFLGCLLFFQHRRGLAVHTLILLAASHLVSATVGIAGYANQHFSFAYPAYYALALLFVRYVARRGRGTYVFPVVAILTIIATFVYRSNPEHRAYLAERQQHTSVIERPLLERIDGMLDACGIDRYAAFGAFQRLAFLPDSPIGPMFVPEFHNYLMKDHPLFLDTYENIRRDARVILLGGDSVPPELEEFVRQRFTAEPPPCAAAYLPLDGLRVLFRTEP